MPVTTFAIAVLSGYSLSLPEVAGAGLAIAALVANNLHQRTALRRPGAEPAPLAAGAGRA